MVTILKARRFLRLGECPLSLLLKNETKLSILIKTAILIHRISCSMAIRDIASHAASESRCEILIRGMQICFQGFVDEPESPGRRVLLSINDWRSCRDARFLDAKPPLPGNFFYGTSDQADNISGKCICLNLRNETDQPEFPNTSRGGGVRSPTSSDGTSNKFTQ
jgi:hypothetical protein